MDGTASLVFIAICVFLPMILAHLEKPEKIVEVIRYETVYSISPQRVKTNAPAKEAVPTIFNDAVDILTSMGMKKSDAKEKVTLMFKKKTYHSIQDFIMDVYKK